MEINGDLSFQATKKHHEIGPYDSCSIDQSSGFIKRHLAIFSSSKLLFVVTRILSERVEPDHSDSLMNHLLDSDSHCESNTDDSSDSFRN